MFTLHSQLSCVSTPLVNVLVRYPPSYNPELIINPIHRFIMLSNHKTQIIRGRNRVWLVLFEEQMTLFKSTWKAYWNKSEHKTSIFRGSSVDIGTYDSFLFLKILLIVTPFWPQSRSWPIASSIGWKCVTNVILHIVFRFSHLHLYWMLDCLLAKYC